MTLKEMKKLSEEEQKVLFKKLKKVRNKAKQVNFACVYSAGPAKIAETAKITLKEATELHKTYWKLNKAVKTVANNVTIKTVRDQMWLQNPISGFWLFLKNDKDRFSLLNQNSGVYFFDTFIKQVRNRLALLQIPIIMQYHDNL